MDELTLDGEIFVSTKRAAKITGYAKDYVGQLCREGRVQARLVGRNWYVLESSIKEHRFGLEETAAEASPNDAHQTQNQPPAAWEAAQYAHESVTEIPTMAKDPIELPDLSPETLDAVVSEAAPDTASIYDEDLSYTDASEVVKEMQSAWQDWFKKENQTQVAQEVADEVLIEAPVADPVAEYERKEENDVEDVEEVPVQVIKQPEEEKIEEESVPLTRITTAPPAPVAPLYEEEHDPVPVYRSYARPEAVPAPVAPVPLMKQESYDLPSHHSRKRNKRRRREDVVVIRENTKSSMLLRVIFIFLALVVIGIAAIGSGYFDNYFNQASLKYYPIQYLGGERVLNK